MSDIVERIEAERIARSIDPMRPANPLLREAADEIRRLRAALETIAGSTTDKLQEMHARQALPNIGPRA